MKKRMTLIMALVIVLSFSTGVISKTVYENIKAQLRPDFVVEIDGEEKEFKNANGERVYPVLYDGTTYLPIRAIGEIMGKTVYWYENEKRIELKDEKEDVKTTVTDADVIVTDEKDKHQKEDKIKEDKTKTDKTDEVNSAKTNNGKTFIGETKAKKIALDKAGLKENEVSFVKVDIDKDDSIFVYDIEFRKDGKEYSFEINAENGEIIEQEVDTDD